MAQLHAAFHPTGFYKTNPGAMTLGELVRWYGWLRLPRSFISSRLAKPASAYWMPGLFAQMQSPRENLSRRLLELTAPACDAFTRLGFSEYGYLMIPASHNLNPHSRDSGLIYYVHSNRSHLGGISYTRQFLPGRQADLEKISYFFQASIGDNNFACSTNRMSFAPPPGSRTIYINAADPAFLYDVFLRRLAGVREAPRSFPDDESLQRDFDRKQWKAFNDRVNRGLFVKMTDAEVDEWRRLTPRAS